MSERKRKYKAGKTTVADEPLTITLRRGDWVRAVVALRVVSKQLNSKDDLRISRTIGEALRVPRGDGDDYSEWGGPAEVWGTREDEQDG